MCITLGTHSWTHRQTDWKGYSECTGLNLIQLDILALIWIFYIVWMLYFSLRKAQGCKILNYRRNLLTMKQHSFMAFCLFFFLFTDQLFMKIIELLPKTTCSEDVFKIWWFFHLVEKIMLFPSKNIFILFSTRRFPEFYGYTGQRLPGQEGPRQILPGKSILI